jgi:HK97 gp10 family phage protein
MKVSNWRANEVFQKFKDEALANANSIMDDVVAAAKALCPVGTITRSGDNYVTRHVSMIPKTGKNKGERVEFKAKTWVGRQPGSLQNSIRRVNKPGSGNVRVYAGNFKVFYARFVERGTVKMEAQPFLRPAFMINKRDMLRRIAGK